MLPALALGAEPPEPGLMAGPPRARARRLLDLPLLLRAYAWLGVVEAAACLAAFLAVWRHAGYAALPLAADEVRKGVVRTLRRVRREPSPIGVHTS